MTKSDDKKRQTYLKKMLRENLVPSVVQSIKKELNQISTRLMAPDTYCIDCGELLSKHKNAGRPKKRCSECSKTNVVLAVIRHQAKLLQCTRCPAKHPESYMTHHKGKLICGDCYRAELEPIDKREMTMDSFLQRNTLIGNGIDQAQTYAERNIVEINASKANRRYTKKRK